MKYAYPAIFTPEDGAILVSVPDLPGLDTFADNVTGALYMARDAIEMWLWDAENKGETIPPASNEAEIAKLCESQDQSVCIVAADTDEYRQTGTQAGRSIRNPKGPRITRISANERNSR